MATYLLIESRDPFECCDTQHVYELAAGLAEAGNRVTLFLVQNGVLPARRSRPSELLESAARAGVEILADDFSLRERGIGAPRIVAGCKPAPIDVVIEHLAAGSKVIWH